MRSRTRLSVLRAEPLEDRLAPFAGPPVTADGFVYSLTDDGAGGFDLWATDGTPTGTTPFEEGAEAAPVPSAFVAVTVKV